MVTTSFPCFALDDKLGILTSKEKQKNPLIPVPKTERDTGVHRLLNSTYV